MVYLKLAANAACRWWNLNGADFCPLDCGDGEGGRTTFGSHLRSIETVSHGFPKLLVGGSHRPVALLQISAAHLQTICNTLVENHCLRYHGIFAWTLWDGPHLSLLPVPMDVTILDNMKS